MKTNAKDSVSAAQQFFTAYDSRDVDGMLGLCADGALGRYAPYGRESVVPIRGGIDVIWRAFPNAVPNFRVNVIELIPAEGYTVVIQAEMSGPIPAEVPGVAKKGQNVHIPHCYILRFDTDSNRDMGKTHLMLFLEFDHGAVLRKETGSNKPKMVRLVIGNPLVMKEMAKHVPDAGSYAPVTVLVDEREDGVHLSYDKMVSFLSPYANQDALTIAHDLDHKIVKLLNGAAVE